MEFWQHVAFLESDQLVDVARKTEESGCRLRRTRSQPLHRGQARRHFDELMASPWPPSPVPVYAGGISDAAVRRAVKEGAIERFADEVIARV